jgi:Zn-dependent protease
MISAMDLSVILPKIGSIYIPMLLALCVHEWAHGFMAKIKGDNTAEMMGRLTLNPVAHIDPIGTVVLPLLAIISGIPIFFGWAKPVPFNPRNLKNPKADSFWIALAGPLSNVILALLAAVIIALSVRMLSGWSSFSALITLLVSFVQINLFLAVFNMIPLHPLDGGKVLARFLPAHINYKLEQNEHMTSLVLMGLILVGALGFLAIPVIYVSRLLIGLATGTML